MAFNNKRTITRKTKSSPHLIYDPIDIPSIFFFSRSYMPLHFTSYSRYIPTFLTTKVKFVRNIIRRSFRRDVLQRFRALKCHDAPVTCLRNVDEFYSVLRAFLARNPQALQKLTARRNKSGKFDRYVGKQKL